MTAMNCRNDDIPPLEELKPLGEIAKRMGMSLQAAHRWRMHPTCPLRCWKVGHGWRTTEEAIHDFIRRRTGGRDAPAPAPTTSAQRKREIEAAHAEARLLLKAR